jgi:putative spermidine/putrescine transport system ATP-binding protein
MGASPEALVRFVGVEKTYDGKTLVLKHLDLDVIRGEFLTLLGASGSGKTTCLMMLAGFETVTTGEIILNGHAITRLPPHKRDIGVVFQNYAVFPHMTVAENVGYPLRVRGVPQGEIRGRVCKALDMVLLRDFGDRRPSQLSGGQQQRVALARALVFNPHLVLMDEPLGALDRQLREQMQYEIKQLHASLGITIVYVTHDQEEALIMSDRVAVLNAGVIEQIGTPADLYDRPVKSFVAQFIGENNALDGTVLAVNDGVCVVRTDSGETVKAMPVNIGPIGSRTSLSLRPECVRFRPAASGAVGGPENNVDAEILSLVYVGDHIRAKLRVCGSDEFVVKVTRDTAVEVELAPGVRMPVYWRVTDCRALDPSPVRA